MAATRIRLTGTVEMKGNITRIAQKFPLQVAAAMARVLIKELEEVKQRTPKLTGALRGSERVLPPETAGNIIRVTMQAGGESAPYAVFVHENLEAFHPVGQAKFMESVINELAPNFLPRVQQELGGLK